ncbi:MAG TPA: EAL domain-containing protein [Alphaproteobacteria bacterium]|mgnify:CR=1 FL=1|nr:MAG: EAL domain-containing protein [Rhodospirillales bacterium]HOO81980.1 EAL domain-containing protein [Alphaproteobacteria bacterium]
MHKDEHKKSFQSGEVIMRQGDAGKCAYIIKTGRVEILIETRNGDTQYVGSRGPGAMIGEMAILDDAPRTATVRATEDCELLEITKEDFALRLENADPILHMMTKVILARYRDMLQRSEITGEPPKLNAAEDLELTYAEGSSAVETIKITNDFESALKRHEISLYYQPVIMLDSGKIAGFEALMRWEHPEKGFISPAVFIPIIEDSGLIVKASAWALKESLMALSRIENRAGYDHELFMSVNFSGRDFAADDFVDSVYETISLSDVSASQVHLEITERLLMGQPDNAKETLSMCQKAGMSISIDDFGTGYSSLSYLHYFPIDTLKIDRSFVKDMLANNGSAALVKAIIGLGKSLNMDIIAEGVESQEEAVALRDLGCDKAQGYYFAKPMPEKEIVDFIIKNRKIEF